MRQTEKMEIIDEAVFQLLLEAENNPPTVREISKKSGFATGTIYEYFEGVTGLFVYFVISRQKKFLDQLKDLIDQHPTDVKADRLLDQLIDKMFDQLRGRNPKMFRFVIHIVLKTAKNPDDFNRSIDILINPLIEARKRDVTGTFPSMEANELRLLLRSMQAVIRGPLFELNPIYGTKEHIELAKSICTRLFLK